VKPKESFYFEVIKCLMPLHHNDTYIPYLQSICWRTKTLADHSAIDCRLSIHFHAMSHIIAVPGPGKSCAQDVITRVGMLHKNL
jgi:hypothetical protein